MARGRPNDLVILDTAGNALSGASVQINIRGGGAATLYSAETGGTTVGNPRTSSVGRIDAWMEEGSYRASTTKSGYTFPDLDFEVVKAFTSFHRTVDVPTGVTATDTTAIQAAIDAVWTAGGGVVQLRAGTYSVSALTLSVSTQRTVQIVGAGKWATYLDKAAGTVTPVLKIEGTGANLETYCPVKDLAIRGDSRSGHGLQLVHAARFAISSVDIRDCDRGIDCSGSLVFTLFDCTIQQNNTGIYGRSLTVGADEFPPNLVRILASEIIGCSTLGIDWQGGGHLIIGSGTDISSNGTSGNNSTGGLWVRAPIATVGAMQTIIRDSWLEGNYGWAAQADIGDLIIDSTAFYFTGASHNMVRGTGLRRFSAKDVHAPSATDTITIDATTQSAHFEGGLIGVINSSSPRTIYSDVTTAAAADPISSFREIRNTQTTNYTLVLGDAHKVVEEDSASARTVTVPPDASVAFPDGTVLDVARIGAGTVTITPGAGVTIQSNSSLTDIIPAGVVRLRKRAANSWFLTGDLV